MSRLEPILDAQDVLGEVPIWCTATQRLFWTDVRACRLHVLEPEGGAHEIHQMPDWAGAIALAGEGRLLVALRKSLVFYDLEARRFELIRVFEADLPDNRSNDGRVDRQGRFWIGTLNNADRIPTGSLYRAPTGTFEHQLGDIIVPNALAWSPDGTTMYFADSWQGDIWAFDFDTDTGTLSNRRVFLAKDALPGIPDGATIDADGCLWHTRYGAGQVARITPDGRVDRVIQSDTMQLTACTFGGSDLRDLYVTSARQRMSDDELAAQPNAGALFRVRLDVPGLPEPHFAG